MKKHHRLEVELTLLGPILTKGSQAAEPGIDAPLARDALGRAMLPYSLVKGKILDAFRDLRVENDTEVHDWLGKESNKGGIDPERGFLRFSDFVTDKPDTNNDTIIERIQIDQEKGSTIRGMLAMLEAPFGYGEPVTFTGHIDFISTEEEAKKIQTALDEAFNWVQAFGSMRTVGFGRTDKIESKLSIASRNSIGSPVPTTALPIRLRLDRPLCIVGPKHSGNHFDSLECIPGAVLKGAVARLVQELTGSKDRVLREGMTGFPNLCRHFEVIRFAEARPMRVADKMKRPVEPPLSIVTCPKMKRRYFDVALWDEPKLIEGAAPAFSVDWKDDECEMVRSAFGWHSLPTERRTRTAINPKKGRAEEHNLFSYSLVLPKAKQDNGTIQEFVWECEIGLEKLSEQERIAIRLELADLLAHGLPNIGKTRAIAQVEWLNRATPLAVGTKAPPDGQHIVTLQTECLMTDPKTLQNKALENSLFTAYQEFWHEVSEGAFELVRFFARQSLNGGFLSKRSRQARYEPFLTTERGSTFVLKPTGTEDGTAQIDAWRTGGLPVPKWVETRYGNSSDPLWMTCPYLPHVGSGEVCIDLDSDMEKQP